MAYLLGNSPLPLFPTLIYRFPFLSTILQAYIICFIVFFIIKNFDNLKSYLSSIRSSTMRFFLDKQSDIKTDLYRFVVLSLLLTFFIDVTLTKLAEQPIVQYIINLIPGLDEISDYVKVSPNATSTLTNVAESLKFGAVKTAIFYFPGVPIGTLLLFILRQLRYKSRKNDISYYPGGTILLVFLPQLLLSCVSTF